MTTNGKATDNQNSFSQKATAISEQLAKNIEQLGAAIDEYSQSDVAEHKEVVVKLQSLAGQGAGLAMTMAECIKKVAQEQSQLAVREMQAIRATFTEVEQWNHLVSEMFE